MTCFVFSNNYCGISVYDLPACGAIKVITMTMLSSV